MLRCFDAVRWRQHSIARSPAFAKHDCLQAGYSPIYKKKTAELYTGTGVAMDGCATFFRKDRFALVKKYEVGRLTLLVDTGVKPGLAIGCTVCTCQVSIRHACCKLLSQIEG